MLFFVLCSIALFAASEALVHGHGPYGKSPEDDPTTDLTHQRNIIPDADTEDLERTESAAAAEKLAMETGASAPLPDSLESLGSRRFDVPFYVYTGGIDWMEAFGYKWKGGPMLIRDWIAKRNTVPRKHSDDFFFLKAALSHPMRTDDPNKAELFVVPGLFNIMTEWYTYIHPHPQLCANVTAEGSTTKLCNFELIGHTERMLANSEWFNRKQGKDHVVVCSGTACEKKTRGFPLIRKCNWIAFEENSMWGSRCHIASTYVGDGCDHVPKQFTVGMISSMKSLKFDTPFMEREQVCKWLGNYGGSSAHSVDMTTSICGSGAQCPALAQSRFGFHVKGDSYGSSRLIDIILSGTVPVFTHPAQYSILPPYVPWKNMSIYVPVTTEDAFIRTLTDNVQLYDHLSGEVNKYASLVDWETSVPFEQYMWLFRQCAQ